MKKNMYYKLKMLLMGFFLMLSGSLLAQAPTNLVTQAYGPNDLVLRWTADPAVESYQVEQSTDSSSFTVLGTTTLDKYDVTNLLPGTTYYFRVTALIGGSSVGEAGLKTETVSRELIVHLPLDEVINDSIRNAVTDSMDAISGGQVTVVNADESGLGVPVLKFLGDGPVPVSSWVRLWNTVQGYEQSLTERTVSLWFKNESPDKNAVLWSFGKRAGGTLAIKDGMLHGLTGMRHGVANKWWADSTGVEFSSSDWTHVTYVFDYPVTRLYVNGTLVDESDGIGKMDGFSGDTALYWPSPWEMNKPVSTDGKSAEIGVLFDPSAPVVAYLGDTWDPNVHGGWAFNGMMSDIKMYNYALTEEEIATMLAEAPANLAVQAVGQTDLVINWDMMEAEGFQVEISNDSASWTVLDTVQVNSYTATGLTPASQYYFRVKTMAAGALGGASGIGASTTVQRMVVDMPLNELVDGTKVKNILTDSLDEKASGELTLIDAAASGLGVPAVKFLGDGPVPISTWVRLYNTTYGIDSSFTERTISFWFKNESPDKPAVLMSFGKRAGMDIALKDGMLHGFTKARIRWSGAGSGNTWWVDSTGVEFNSDAWTHVAYVFDNPVTKIYVNGVLADESDGVGFYRETERDTLLPWPTQMGMNVPTSGDGKSAEMGALFEPSAAMVQYMGDTWDNGVHSTYSFNGMMSSVKMYNYALSEEDIMAQYAAYGVEVSNFNVWAQGVENLTLAWDNVEGNTGYVLEQSENGTTWSEAATLEADVTHYTVEGLTAGTEYFFKLIPQGVGEVIANNETSGTTVTPQMVVHFDFAELINGTGIKNVVTDSVDEGVNGSVEVADIPEDEIVRLDQDYRFKPNTGKITFNQSENPPVTSYVRLAETVMPAKPALNQRTVTVWLKNEDPSRMSVPLSMGKRSGITFAYNEGMFHAFTGMRPTNKGPWYADSTGTELNENTWNHITYVYDDPVTKVYINGALADESDGLFYNDGAKAITELPFPSDIGIDPLSSTSGKSSEIGALFEPAAPLVYYMGGTWDLGARNPFYGSMADLRFYNYALSEEEITAVVMENLEATSAADELTRTIEVYPNPASDVLYIRNAVQADITILDNTGKVVMRRNLSNNNHISITELPTGIYFVRIEDQNSVVVNKISVIR